MKVNDSYAYDEFEGFEPIKVVSDRSRSTDIWLNIQNGKLFFSKATRDLLFGKTYLHFRWNAKTQQLLVNASSQPGEMAVKLTKSHAHAGLSCNAVSDLLSQEAKRDRSVVNMILPGTPCHSAKDAVIFDLHAAIYRKPVQKNRAKK